MNLSEPQCPFLKSGLTHAPSLTELYTLEEIMEVMGSVAEYSAGGRTNYIVWPPPTARAGVW